MTHSKYRTLNQGMKMTTQTYIRFYALKELIKYFDLGELICKYGEHGRNLYTKNEDENSGLERTRFLDIKEDGCLILKEGLRHNGVRGPDQHLGIKEISFLKPIVLSESGDEIIHKSDLVYKFSEVIALVKQVKEFTYDYKYIVGVLKECLSLGHLCAEDKVIVYLKEV